ncbi:MAG: HAD-IA family hydrolase [Oscillospiraceae bacterium]|nr:HAD-IA family hydrolase [Oscillospiraceae bacterium]
MDFKHMIWDFDGTLFDTYPHTAQAFLNMLKKEYLVNENVLEIERHMRISLQYAYDFYKDKFEIDDDFIQKFDEYRKVYENMNALPFNNAYLVCKFVYDQGGANYIFTHRDTSVNSMLQKHGFFDIFKDFVTSEDGFARKPSPDGLLHLIKKHDMNKEETLYVGDRGIDLQCAAAAGIKSCLYKKKLNLIAEEAGADFIVQNLSDFYYIINSTLTTKKS